MDSGTRLANLILTHAPKTVVDYHAERAKQRLIEQDVHHVAPVFLKDFLLTIHYDHHLETLIQAHN